MKYWFVHPDLGIGGAERLVVDAAVGLKDIRIYTCHYEQNRAFPETKQMDIRIHGDFPWLPFAYLIQAMIRNIYLCIRLIMDAYSTSDELVIIVDQLSISVPLLKVFLPWTRVLFYCHYPDKLLSKRDGFLKKLYRIPLDILEEATTACADTILVNSKFTQSVFKKSFWIPEIPKVLYPGIQLPLPDTKVNRRSNWIVSINRYEDKKNVHAVVSALRDLPSIKLIIAGGYDPRSRENINNLVFLKQTADQLHLSHIEAATLDEVAGDARIVFMKNISDEQKEFLLRACYLLVYTPENEHFGIVPVEAMARGCLVVGMASGGVKETVVDGQTGWLTTPNDLAIALRAAYKERDIEAMRKNAVERVKNHFTREVFIQKLRRSIEETRASGFCLYITLLLLIASISIQYMP